MRVLIIGKLQSQITEAIQIAKKHGADVAQADSTETAIARLLDGNSAELVLIDVELDIAQFIAEMDQNRIHSLICAYGINSDSKAAVKAIKAGAKEYIPLPPDEELIAAVLESIAEESNQMIFHSKSMKDMVALADRIAPSGANVMITGESGTGKEVMARYIHNNSTRKNKPFVSVNCAAIPENLLESELFGHEKGAFTGAANRRIGKFEESSGGTLLLDEISEMDIRLQAKLLRAIQEKEIDRVGGNKPVKVDLRVLATSNRDLKKEVEAGNFREDLLFRLNVIQLALPPLRDRKEDIPYFAEFFASKYSEANGLPKTNLSDAALEALKNYNWPGNVREMENCMHRAVLLCTSEAIEPDTLQLPTDGTSASANNSAETSNGTAAEGTDHLVGKTVEQVEKDLIISTLGHCLGNRTQAAHILGISIRTLRNKLNQYKQDEAS